MKSHAPLIALLLPSMIHKVKWHPIDNAAPQKKGPTAEGGIKACFPAILEFPMLTLECVAILI